ncbi:MAG: hypothetical protein AAF417_06005 [Pseudomonadota bacterium]
MRSPIGTLGVIDRSAPLFAFLNSLLHQLELALVITAFGRRYKRKPNDDD